MKPNLKQLFLLLACSASIHVIYAQEKLIAPKKTLKAMELANQYFMNKWPDPAKPIVNDTLKKNWPSNIWTRAVYYEGFMALYNVDKKDAYLKYATQWAEGHQWGLNKGVETRNADNQCAGQTYIDLYMIKKDSNRIRDIKASMDLMLISDKNDDWWWIDALQMGMPVFTKLGVYYHENRYFDKMYDLYSYTKHQHGGNGLYNAQEHLWWRDKDFVPPFKTPNGENCYWSRGNGWVIAAYVRVLSLLPKSDSHYAEYLQDYKDMMNTIVKLQRTDGFWNASLHDPKDFGGKEATGTSLFVYGMAWGINNNILDVNSFKPAMVKGWNALVKESLHKNGFLGYVQGTGKEPKGNQPVTYDKIPDFEDFGLGCFLLAGSEIYKLNNP
jgi:rhamnogalacturonyl hydrolase YesR